MSINARLARAESGLAEALFWKEAQVIARESGQSPQDIFDEFCRLTALYGHYIVELPGDRIDAEPMVRAIAQGEGIDYDELMAESRKGYRRFLRRVRR